MAGCRSTSIQPKWLQCAALPTPKQQAARGRSVAVAVTAFQKPSVALQSYAGLPAFVFQIPVTALMPTLGIQARANLAENEFSPQFSAENFFLSVLLGSLLPRFSKSGTRLRIRVHFGSKRMLMRIAYARCGSWRKCRKNGTNLAQSPNDKGLGFPKPLFEWRAWQDSNPRPLGS